MVYSVMWQACFYAMLCGEGVSFYYKGGFSLFLINIQLRDIKVPTSSYDRVSLLF